jgi:pimeloyl-ACP methyl ester carboxylesterase
MYQYEIKNRVGINPKLFKYHNHAISLSGFILPKLNITSCPTLVVHGTKDPLINLGHAKKYVNLLPQTKKLFVEGMGHVLPSKFLDQITKTILDQLFSNNNNLIKT